jgi:hypothetical protein
MFWDGAAFQPVSGPDRGSRLGVTSQIVREEMARHRCVGDDETPLIVLQYRLVERIDEPGKSRLRPGARRAQLETGEALRVIDARTFEVIATGELVRRID